MNSREILPQEKLLDWNYGNTLEKQEFNALGFYDPPYNVEVKAGVPKSLAPLLEKCSQENLFECSTPNYGGNVGCSDRVVAAGSETHLVKSSPINVYSNAS